MIMNEVILKLNRFFAKFFIKKAPKWLVHHPIWSLPHSRAIKNHSIRAAEGVFAPILQQALPKGENPQA